MNAPNNPLSRASYRRLPVAVPRAGTAGSSVPQSADLMDETRVAGVLSDIEPEVVPGVAS